MIYPRSCNKAERSWEGPGQNSIQEVTLPPLSLGNFEILTYDISLGKVSQVQGEISGSESTPSSQITKIWWVGYLSGMQEAQFTSLLGPVLSLDLRHPGNCLSSWIVDSVVPPLWPNRYLINPSKGEDLIRYTKTEQELESGSKQPTNHKVRKKGKKWTPS